MQGGTGAERGRLHLQLRVHLLRQLRRANEVRMPKLPRRSCASAAPKRAL